MPDPLAGVGVLITRPEQQAGPLCRLFEAQGAAVYRLPAISIVEHPDRRAVFAQLSPLPDFDLIIFTSVNAVRFGAPLLAGRRDLTLAAIGPATARALNQEGYRIGIVPPEGFDSEHLLESPRLRSIAGARVLLVKGAGGRELLEQTLTGRGARVQVATVYERRPATPSPQKLAEVERAMTGGRLHLVTATSLEIARQLLAIVPAGLRRLLEQATWLVPGARVGAGLRAAGVTGALLTADSAEDQALVEAALRWRSSVSGA